MYRRRRPSTLLAIYREACRVQRDRRLGESGRLRHVIRLDDEILAMCGPMWLANEPPCEGVANDYRFLVNEVMRLMLADELFSFVRAEPVEQPNGTARTVGGTNNEAERTLRGPTQARQTGRTNKTLVGARRQTILTSVLESLRVFLPTFTMASMLAEVQRWTETGRSGRSCFQELFEKLQLRVPETSVLDRVIPEPSD